MENEFLIYEQSLFENFDQFHLHLYAQQKQTVLWKNIALLKKNDFIPFSFFFVSPTEFGERTQSVEFRSRSEI